MKKVLLLLMLIPFGWATGKDDPVRVLIVDGFSNHNWQLNTQLIKDIIEPTGLFEVDVSTAPETIDAPGWDDWRPDFAAYDVVVQTCNSLGNRPSWPEPVKAAFVEYVRNGGGVYIWHAGNNSFEEWPEYNDIIGLGWRKADFGYAITIDENEKVVRIPPGEGEKTGHGPRHDTVVRRLGDHPIHKGMPRAWMTPDIEVYYYARGPAKNLQVLSYGINPKNNMNWPLEWTVKYGKGRVYNSTFGHVWKNDEGMPDRMRCVGLQTIIIRTLEWLAGKDITWPVPEDFPTESTISLVP
jgi:type 1 glutamine amidotransferase